MIVIPANIVDAVPAARIENPSIAGIISRVVTIMTAIPPQRLLRTTNCHR